MKSIIKKLITVSRIGLICRYFKYKKVTKFLNVKNGFVVGMNQLEYRDGKMHSTGNDPFVLIKLFSLTNKVRLTFEVETQQNDVLEMYYVPNVMKSKGFSQEWCKKYGISDGKLYIKEILLYDEAKNIRLDFGGKEGIIDIRKFEIVPEINIKNQKDINELILNNISNLNKKEKIVIVTHSMNETGAPLLAYNISKYFFDRKYDIVVISLGSGYLEEKYSELGIPVFNLYQDGINDRIVKLEALEYIVKSLKEKGYENVITNTIISGLTVPIFNKYNYKIVSLIHEMKNSILQYNMEAGGRNIDMYSDTIVFPDKIVERDFVEIFGKNNNKSVICPQGLYKIKEKIFSDRTAILEEYNIPVNSKIIVGSGTADLRKGIDLFLNAAQHLVKIEKNEEYHFIWAGKISDENIENWYSYQLERSGISNRFHNIEFIKDKDKYQNLITCSDAFWLTSREDPFPSVMIESLEFGTPVLAFKNCGGADTLLKDGRGILIENFDTNMLAEETYKLLNDSKRIECQIKKSQKYISEKLVFNNYINSLEKMFKKDEKKQFANLSVIVPNYNYEEYLPIRLNSIIKQTIKPKEIILLDDVSTDDSIEVCKKILKQAKKEYGIDFKIVVNKENNGCFRQWLKGIKLAKYEYIWIAEADDYAQNNFVETLMPAFNDTDVAIAYCQSKVINEKCNVVNYDYKSYTADLDETKWNNDFVDDGKKQIIKYFSKKNILPNVSSAIIKKSATNKLYEELEKYNVIGDWLAYIYILKSGKIFYSSKSLNGHRRHSNSIIAKKEKTIEFIKEILMIKNYILKNIKMNDKEINKLLLSIENFDYYSKKISQYEELSNIYKECKKNIKELKQKENLLIIIPDLSVGGGQSVAIRLANSFTKKYNVFIVNAREYIKNPIMENMINDDVILLTKNSVNDLKIYNELLDFKAVISFIWWSDKLAYQAFGNTNTKLILSMHGCYEMLLHNPNVDDFFNVNYEKILKRADRIVYTAEKNKEVLEKTNIINFKKVSKIDNGFILGKYPKKFRESLGIKKDDFVFGLVARAIPEKGYEEAIKAINIVNSKSKNKAHLILVGASDYINTLKEKYKEDYIHFIDKFTLPNEWIGWEEIFDVGLLPSYFKSESLPTVIVENLFLGNPVIATDIAEIKTMLVDKNESAGIVINLCNGKASVKELSVAMENLMHNKELFNNLKSNTSKFAKRFDMNECIKKYSNLIEDDEDE